MQVGWRHLYSSSMYVCMCKYEGMYVGTVIHSPRYGVTKVEVVRTNGHRGFFWPGWTTRDVEVVDDYWYGLMMSCAGCVSDF